MTTYNTDNFSQAELECKCGNCDFPGMDDGFMQKLQMIRTLINKPIHLNSAYRCPEYDASIGGAGVHPTGQAVDIACSGHHAHDILKEAMFSVMSGVGIKQHGDHASRFIHLDNTIGPTRPWVWSYK